VLCFVCVWCVISCDVCYLCVVSYCSTLPRGKNPFAVKTNNNSPTSLPVSTEAFVLLGYLISLPVSSMALYGIMIDE
jgi:hypothetical protein